MSPSRAEMSVRLRLEGERLMEMISPASNVER
jgi:hypothetical protein